eukprot:888209-Ditylum_brightwellii.AAC.1
MKVLATRLIKGLNKRKFIYTYCIRQSNVYHWNKQRVHIPTVTQCHPPVTKIHRNLPMAKMRLIEGVASVATSIVVVFLL